MSSLRVTMNRKGFELTIISNLIKSIFYYYLHFIIFFCYRYVVQITIKCISMQKYEQSSLHERPMAVLLLF